MTLAYELVALRRAHDLAGPVLPPALAAVMDETTAVVEPVDCDRSLAPDVERARELVRSRALLAAAAGATEAGWATSRSSR